MEYYYFNNIDKARYYHNRMMNNELEKSSLAKEYNVTNLNKSRQRNAYKKTIIDKTIFEKYKDKEENFKYLHDNNDEVKILELRLNKIERKNLLISPKYEQENVKDRVLRKALRRALQDPAKDSDELRRLNNKYLEHNKKSKTQ